MFNLTKASQEKIKTWFSYTGLALLFLVPLTIGVVGGNAFFHFFDFLDKTILTMYRYALVFSIIIGYAIAAFMFLFIYKKNNRTVKFVRYLKVMSVANLFVILFLMIMIFGFIGFLQLVINQGWGISLIEPDDIFQVKNFGNLYFYEVALIVMALLCNSIYKTLFEYEIEKSPELMAKIQKEEFEPKRKSKKKDGYTVLRESLMANFAFLPKHLMLDELTAEFDEFPVDIIEKTTYLQGVLGKVEEKASELFNKAGISELEYIKSNYEIYVDADINKRIQHLELKDVLESKLRYTMYKYLRQNSLSLALFNNIYADNKAGNINPKTNYQSFDEIGFQRSVFGDNNIHLDEKFNEIVDYYVKYLRELNLIFEKIHNERESIIINNDFAKKFEEFTREATILRNIKLLEDLVIDARTVIFSPRGIFEPYHIKYNDKDNLYIDEDGRWFQIMEDGTKIPNDELTSKINNYVANEKNFYSKKLNKHKIDIEPSIDINPIIIIDNDKIAIINKSNGIVIHNHELYAAIQEKPIIISDDKVEALIKIFGKKADKQLSQVDYTKAIEELISKFIKYCEELKYISGNLDLAIAGLRKAHLMSPDYELFVKDIEIKFYGYDFLLHAAGHKYYNKDVYEEKLSYDSKRFE